VLGAEHTSTLAAKSNLAAPLEPLEDRLTLRNSMSRRPRLRAGIGSRRPVHTCGAGLPRRHLQGAREAGDAVELSERTLVDRERVLGVSDLETIKSRQYLAMAYQQIGRTDEAIALFERTLDDRQRLLRTIIRIRRNPAEPRRRIQLRGRTADAAALFP